MVSLTCKSQNKVKSDISNQVKKRNYGPLLKLLKTEPILLLKVENLLECNPAAAAKLLQSCPALCDPIDGSPPGSAVSGTLAWSGLPFPSPVHEREK